MEFCIFLLPVQVHIKLDDEVTVNEDPQCKFNEFYEWLLVESLYFQHIKS